MISHMELSGNIAFENMERLSITVPIPHHQRSLMDLKAQIGTRRRDLI
jgi:hypothetical protein